MNRPAAVRAAAHKRHVAATLWGGHMLRRWCHVLATTALVAVVFAPAVRADDDKPDKKSDKKPTVAVFKLEGELTEQPAPDAFPFGSLNQTNLKDLVAHMNKAAADS